MSAPPTVIWHDLECGAYREDIALWLALAWETRGPVLDVGAGTGRVALALAQAGYEVTALDSDPELLAELRRRAGNLPIAAIEADARDFTLTRTDYPLCIVPMQTVQLLGGATGRTKFLAAARRHLRDKGLLALAIATALELFEVAEGGPAPLPDMRELDGYVYCSQAIAVRRDGDAYVLERVRETVTPAGARTAEDNVIRLDRISARELAREGVAAGFEDLGIRRIPATVDHVGSEVVVLRA